VAAVCPDTSECVENCFFSAPQLSREVSEGHSGSWGKLL
jgi:hypothetical protein